MLALFDNDTPKEEQLAAMKAVDSRLAELGGGGYVGLAFKIKGLMACGFEERGRPNPVQKIAAYQKAIAILNQLGNEATKETFIALATTPPA
jgi:hypothetical protein